MIPYNKNYAREIDDEERRWPDLRQHEKTETSIYFRVQVEFEYDEIPDEVNREGL